jgi:hypothetical protein
MGQYMLWMHHREIDQHLRGKQTIYEQELAEIDERIARIEKTAMQTNNALLTMLMQQIRFQEYTTNKVTVTTGTQPEYSGARQESTNSQNYQTPPSSNYGQPSTPATPPSSAWNQLLNLNAQEMPLPDKQMLSAETAPVRPEELDPQPANDLHTLFKQELLKNAQPSLPWWLRNLMQNTNADQETQEIPPIDQQSIPTNPPVERETVRRTRLIHYIQEPHSQS